MVELGVRWGASTTAFIAAVEGHEDGFVWSCDVKPFWREVGGKWDGPSPLVYLENHPQWSFNLGDDIELNPLAPPCNLLFIDTSHTYEHTLVELEHYFPKVTPGGYICMHDIYNPNYPGVMRAVNDFGLREKCEDFTLHSSNFGMLVARKNNHAFS